MVCFPEETFQHTKTTTGVKTLVPMFVFISSDIVAEQNFPCNSNQHDLVAAIIGSLEKVAFKETQKKNLFFDVETTKKMNLGSFWEKLAQSPNGQKQVRRVDMNQDDRENKKCTSTQLLQIERKPMIELQETLICLVHRFTSVWFQQRNRWSEFNENLSATHCSLRTRLWSKFIKKANQFIAANFGDLKL